MEIWWIGQEIALPSKGYKQSPEHREKISTARKGWIFSEETRNKLRLSHLGQTHSLETRAKISLALSRRVVSLETREKMGNASRGNQRAKGFRHSQKSRDRMSASQMGHPFHGDTSYKISAPQRELFWAFLMAVDPGTEIHLEYPVMTSGGTRFIDIAFPEQMLAVEYDGLYWHPEKDFQRDKELTVLGWKVIYVRDSKIWYTVG